MTSEHNFTHSTITHFQATSFFFLRLLKYHRTKHHSFQRSRHKKWFFIARHDDGDAGGRIGLFPLCPIAEARQSGRKKARRRRPSSNPSLLFPNFSRDPHLMGRPRGGERRKRSILWHLSSNLSSSSCLSIFD